MESRNLTYFISDLHLGAGYFINPRAHEKAVVAWLRSIAPTAKRLYLMGDILDYWYEYRYVVPRGYTRFFGALAELADSGVEITWFIGNHDIWIFDYLPKEIGLRVVDGSLIEKIDGRTFYMSHGDGVGSLPISFRILRSVFRNKLCQRLFAAIHPRWTVGFAHRWSSHSRKANAEGCGLQNISATLVEYAQQYTKTHPGNIDYFVFGHCHQLLQQSIDDSSEVIILGDWITHFSYGVFDGRQMQIHTSQQPQVKTVL
jgi:UDP-2,3-diacylglucosamine hydrolase